jgi:uncharacterized protein YdhG (YjbR/CyaY superfamily)
VSKQEIDAYIANVDEPKRSTLEQLRQTILGIIPEAEEGMSYGMPAFRLNGKVIAGFAAFREHLSYLPHSGAILGELADDLAGYAATKGSLHFPVDEPLPEALVRRLIEARISQLKER